MEPFDPETISAAYDQVADDYALAFADDLDHLPVDRTVLDAGIKRVPGTGPVLDIGCGPAQVAHYLAERGISVIGVDLASEMLRVARRRGGATRLVCADMRSLPVRSGSCAGAVMFYSLQHLSRPRIGDALAETRRVLVPGGILILATHLGDGEVHLSEFLGHVIEPMGGTLHRHDEIERALLDASFELEGIRLREPLPHEYPSTRLYAIARLADSSVH